MITNEKFKAYKLFRSVGSVTIPSATAVKLMRESEKKWLEFYAEKMKIFKTHKSLTGLHHKKAVRTSAGFVLVDRGV